VRETEGVSGAGGRAFRLSFDVTEDEDEDGGGASGRTVEWIVAELASDEGCRTRSRIQVVDTNPN